MREKCASKRRKSKGKTFLSERKIFSQIFYSFALLLAQSSSFCVWKPSTFLIFPIIIIIIIADMTLWASVLILCMREIKRKKNIFPKGNYVPFWAYLNCDAEKRIHNFFVLFLRYTQTFVYMFALKVLIYLSKKPFI